MRRAVLKRERGYALLLMMLGLMGFGSVVAANYVQSVKRQAELDRELHNQRVLQEAKRALLQFAYNYPQTDGNGPGRLPCPDTDNDGQPETPFNCGDVVGRLPWNQPNLNLYDIRDADGERLWYAVSANFSTQDATPLNSDSAGTLTIRDQTGNIVYDGTTGNGVAAVVIAPGVETERNGVAQDRSVVNGDDRFDTVPDTDPGIVNAANYLDLFFGIEDNAALVQGGANGFISGRVDPLGADSVIVNDRIIVITVDEVLEMAEKATLQAYRDAIEEYLANTGNIYPWLYNYQGVTSVAEARSFFPGLANFTDPFVGERVTYLGNRGRVPSMFGAYFAAAPSRPIESKLDVGFTLAYPVTPLSVDRTGGVGTPFAFNAGAAHTIAVQTANVLTDVRFEDDGFGNGRLRADAGTTETFTQVLYFWDNDEVAPTGVWTLCPDDGDGVSELSDCHRQSDGTPNPGGANDNREEILRVVLEFEIDGTVNFDADYAALPAPVFTPPDANGHARISMTINGTDVVSALPISATYEHDEHYHEGGAESFEVDESGTIDVTDLSLVSLTLGLRYYPELPDWAFIDGWHDSILMAYGADYLPDAAGGPCDEIAGACLEILNSAGNRDNKVSLLVIAGQHDWFDEGGDGFFNDLLDVFDPDNDDQNDDFDARAANGNDQLLVIQEL